MRISTKGRYALRLLVDLAENEMGGYIALRDVSHRQEISVKYLEQIITQLSRAGLVKSSRGPQGGYRLTKKIEDYRVGDILRVTEGKLAPVACLEDEENQCPRVKDCAVIDLWEGLQEVIENYLDGITLQDLIDKRNKKYDGRSE